MKTVARANLAILGVLISVFSVAQEQSPYAKFGKVTVADLSRKVYSIDSNASAVVLCDIGSFAIQGNTKGFFSVAFKRHRVVHILNKNGYDEADVVIPLYSTNDHEERLTGLKAVTYNLEKGKLVQTKLDKNTVFRDEKTRNYTQRKFTFPQVKEGSIIEYEYEVVSDYISNLDPWVFQGEAPRLWSEITFSVPEFLTYAFLRRGYHPYHIYDRKDRKQNFTVFSSIRSGTSDRVSFSAGVSDFRWVMIDVPSIREEDFSSALVNHLSSIEFQMAGISPPLEPRSFKTSWPNLAKELLESEEFGRDIQQRNSWLKDHIGNIINNDLSETEKAKRLFEFVRDKFTCTSHYSLYLSQDLKQVMKTRKGNVADINLLLTAMLRYAGLNADPVILSTRDHGFAPEDYPMISYFNYVIIRVTCDEQNYFLDASRQGLGFGKLSPSCYNGHARIINPDAPAVYLDPDSLIEKKYIALLISEQKGGKWMGKFEKIPGETESYLLRSRFKQNGVGEFFNSLEKNIGLTATISNKKIDSLNQYEQPLAIRCDVALNIPSDDIFYFHPLFGNAYTKNPFQSAERHYPVELPYQIDETIVASIAIPEGYEVDELPSQLVVKLDQAESGYFEYRIGVMESTISLRTVLRFNRTVFMPEEYEGLRKFFGMIVSKHAEYIVFKKKN